MIILLSLIILLVLAVVAARKGVFSVEFLLTVVIFAPAFSPVYAYALGAARFTQLNPSLQLSQSHMQNVSLIMAAAAVCYAVVLLVVSRPVAARPRSVRSMGPGDTLVAGSRSINDLSFLAIVTGILFFAWLCEPGPTILQATYAEVRAGRIPGTQFAGAFFLLFWSLGIVMLQDADPQRIRPIWRTVFWAVTLAAAVWLLLHARRQELAGIMIVVALLLQQRLGTKRTLLIAFAMLLSLVASGVARHSLGAGGSLAEILEHGIIAGVDGDVRKVPGGAGNVYMTMLSTVDIIQTGKTELLYGKTYFDYILHMIPTNLENMIGFEAPERFNRIIERHWTYGGGLYVFAPGYGNFGMAGVVGVSIVLAGVVAFAAQCWRHSDCWYRLLALAVIASMFKIAWYSPIMTFKLVLLIVVMALVWKLAKVAATA